MTTLVSPWYDECDSRHVWVFFQCICYLVLSSVEHASGYRISMARPSLKPWESRSAVCQTARVFTCPGTGPSKRATVFLVRSEAHSILSMHSMHVWTLNWHHQDSNTCPSDNELSALTTWPGLTTWPWSTPTVLFLPTYIWFVVIMYTILSNFSRNIFLRGRYITSVYNYVIILNTNTEHKYKKENFVFRQARTRDLSRDNHY